MSIVTYYCGEENMVRVSTDEGVSWSSADIPGTLRTLYDIMAWPQEPNKVTTVGALGGIYYSTNAGFTWTNATPLLGTGYTFEEVWNIDSDNSVVAGWLDSGGGNISPVFFKSTDGGVSYTQGLIRDSVNIGTDIFKQGKATAIHFLTDQIGVMSVYGDFNTLPGYTPLGYNVCYVLLTTNGGTSWTVTNSNQYVSDLESYGIKIGYDYGSGLYIINVVTRNNVYRSINSGLAYSITDISTKGQHLTWIGDSNIWYTEQSNNSIKLSLNNGATWAVQQSGIPSTAGRAAHFYKKYSVPGITGFYSHTGNRLFKSLDSGVTGFLSDSAPGGNQIWAVWTESPYKCYLLENCQDPTIQYVFTDNDFLGECGFDFANNIGETVTIQSTIAPNPCPEVADGITCWRIIQETPCSGQFCNQVIP